MEIINSPHYFKDRIDPDTKQVYNPDILVLHITDGSYEATKAWFENPRSYVSSNWVVKKDGTWVQCVDEKDAPFTNGRIYRPTSRRLKDISINPNLYSVTVEVVNRGEMPSWNQWISWARGCREVMNRYNMDIFDVVDHYEIAGNKTCPRPWFTRFWLKRLLPYT